MKNPNADGPSYIRVSHFFNYGDPFGYIEGDHFVIIGPEENKAYLVDAQDEISRVNQSIDQASNEEIVAQVNAVYPAVGFLTWQIKSLSVGDKVNIGGEV